MANRKQAQKILILKEFCGENFWRILPLHRVPIVLMEKKSLSEKTDALELCVVVNTHRVHAHLRPGPGTARR